MLIKIKNTNVLIFTFLQVVDILRVTELYSSHLKTENIKYDDPVTSDLIGALITVLQHNNNCVNMYMINEIGIN